MCPHMCPGPRSAGAVLLECVRGVGQARNGRCGRGHSHRCGAEVGGKARNGRCSRGHSHRCGAEGWGHQSSVQKPSKPLWKKYHTNKAAWRRAESGCRCVGQNGGSHL